MSNLATLQTQDRLPIGTLVDYHHRAAVARWRSKGDRPGWYLSEGTFAGEYFPGSGPFENLSSYLRDHFVNWPRTRFGPYKVNKTVMVWPDDGAGRIVGSVRRSIGQSVSSSGGGEDFDQGYHVTDMYVDLYCIKHAYERMEYILVPIWAVQEREVDLLTSSIMAGGT